MDLIEQGFKEAEEITRHYAKTFYLASNFLPQEKKRFSYAVYAICRLSDECVDGARQGNPEEKLKQLREKIERVYSQGVISESLLSSLRYTVIQCHIPKEYFLELIKGMEMDLVKKRYADFRELHLYCYRAAATVGLIMLKVLKVKNDAAQEYAINLSIAMQLTNIIRDIKEDFLRGRIYIPIDEIERFGIKEENFGKDAGKTDSFRRLLSFQIKRSREYYRLSAPGIKYIPGINTRLVIAAMSKMYSAILTRVEQNNYDVFSKRAVIGYYKKILIIMEVILKGEYLCR